MATAHEGVAMARSPSLFTSAGRKSFPTSMQKSTKSSMTFSRL